ncbi:hypothetical protein [Streptomyces lydicus]|uniref:hypothetical protein n=1 Tax=Streptomyces lydicus TaxID=47763 RepID=UPI0034429250
MPPPTCDETLSIDVLTVTLPKTLITAALILPLLPTLNSTASLATAALLTACLKTAAHTQVSYQRIRRNITIGRPLPSSTGH